MDRPNDRHHVPWLNAQAFDRRPAGRVTSPRWALFVPSTPRDLADASYFDVMLLEDDVVDAVAGLLRQQGWTIESVAYAHQRGDDIVATKDGVRLLVEAKGEGSSKALSKRYGKPFTGNQVGSHVGVAVVRALRWASLGEARAALAFPDNPHHRRQVDPIAPALEQVGIGVFWVTAERYVQLASPWTL